MSLDRSLKSKNTLVRQRNVLTRAERIAILLEEERWDPSKSVFGLPKVAPKRVRSSGKSKAASAPAEEAAEQADEAQQSDDSGQG